MIYLTRQEGIKSSRIDPKMRDLSTAHHTFHAYV